jgi:hypothetical protein
MTRTQQYLLTMLDRLPVYELSGDGPRVVMERLKERFDSHEDLQAELKRLFRVRGFSDFALSLLWIVDKVDHDPSRLESSEDEEKFVFMHFRKAMAAAGPLPAIDAEPDQHAPDPSFLPEPGSEPARPVVDHTPEPEPEPGAAPEFSGFEQDAGVPLPPTPPPPAPGDPSHPETEFAELLERFIEALQTGSVDRSDQLHELVSRCDVMAAQEHAGDDLKQFAFLLQDLLHFVEDNQFLDDPRVMNVMTNAQEPFAQWVRTDVSARTGMLDHALEILRDARLTLE